MKGDMEDDLAIVLMLREMIAREQAPPDADPSLFAPWGLLRYDADYKSGKCNRPN